MEGKKGRRDGGSERKWEKRRKGGKEGKREEERNERENRKRPQISRPLGLDLETNPEYPFCK